MEAVWLIVGIAIGGAAAALATWVAMRARLHVAEERLEEVRASEGETQKRISDAFGSLAADALKSNNEAFLQLANQSLETQLTRARGDLDSRRQAVEELVKPLAENLKKIERERLEAYGGLKAQAEAMAKGQQELAGETRNLTQALRSPQVRGRWGEMTLRRAVELAGMVDRCDFAEQKTFAGEAGNLRPDMVINLPNDRRIVIDAKTPMDAYLESIEADTDEQRASALQRHAGQVRDRVRELSAKSYWRALDYTPEFVVLFLPGEFLLGPALQREPTLLEDGIMAKVVMATPSTLIALLHAVAYGWREERLAETARAISDQGRELHDRIAVWAGHLESMRGSLSKAVESFNKGVGSLESRVLISTRRFKELGVTSVKDVPKIPPIEMMARPLPDQADDDPQDSLS